jgi:putative transposase
LGGFTVIGSRLKLSKVGPVKVKLHREITGNPKRCTIIRDVDQWFACVIVEREQESVDAALVNAKPPVGVDLGTANLAVLSDGTVFHNPKHFYHSVERINALQKCLSKKRSGSHKREKTKLLLAKAYRKVRRQRDDTAHKVSRYLADTYSSITFEDLKILNMVKNHHLASAITDSAWGRLRALTAYKAERRGGRVILVNPAGNVAEMLWMRRGSSQGLIGGGSPLSPLRSHPRQGCQRCEEHPETGSGTGPCGGAAPTCPAKEDKQVRSREAGSLRIHPG